MDSIYDNAGGRGTAAAFDLGTMRFMQEPYAPLRGKRGSGSDADNASHTSGKPDYVEIVWAAEYLQKSPGRREKPIFDTWASWRAGFQWKKI